MIYTSTITSGALRLRESRVVARLMLSGADDAIWSDSLYTKNLLNQRSTESTRRITSLIKARLATLNQPLLETVHVGNREKALQVLLAASVKHSRLLGDFIDISVREHWARFEGKLTSSAWDSYLEGCKARDPQMPNWSDSTANRLRSTVYSVLNEVGFLENTRNLVLKRVYVDPVVKGQLEAAGEVYALRCLEVTQ